MSLLRPDGTYLEGRVEQPAFKKGDTYTLLKSNLRDAIDSSGCVRVSLHIWSTLMRNRPFPSDKNGFLPCLIPADHAWLKDFPQATAMDGTLQTFARSCTAVTRWYVEEVVACLGPDVLHVLRNSSEIYVLAASALGRGTLFHVRCKKEMDDTLSISIRKVKYYIEIDVLWYVSGSLVDASGNTIHHIESSLIVSNQFKELPTFIKWSDLFIGESEKNCSIYLLITRKLDQAFIEQTSYTPIGTIEEPTCTVKEPTCNHRAPSRLQQSILRLYRDGLYFDFTLNTVDGTLGAHKTVLEASSPVFEAMINRDTVERNSNSAEIKDVARDTMEGFLEFLYTDSVQDLDWEKAARLYYAADKYEVLPLKNTCSSFLAKHLSVENVCEILALADRHKDGELKSSVLEFLLKVETNFFDSKEWDELSDANFKLASDVMKHLYKSAKERK